MPRNIFIIMIGVLIIGGGLAGYFAMHKSANSSALPQIKNEQAVQNQEVHKEVKSSQISLENWIAYKDPQGRFSFMYPPGFGTPSRGTDDGFGDRVAAIRFPNFSSGIHGGTVVLGGEATITKGFVLVDMQALGGLYDSLGLQVFPEKLRNTVLVKLKPLDVSNFCAELAKERHIELDKPSDASLAPQVKDAIHRIDQSRNIDPKVNKCDREGDTITFHKEATFESGKENARQNIYGAIKFLPSPFSSFQIVRVTTEPPSKEMLDTITLIVKSFK